MALIFGHSIDGTNIRAFDRWREHTLVYYITLHRSPHLGDPAIAAALRNNTASRRQSTFTAKLLRLHPPQQTHSLHSGNPNIAQWIRISGSESFWYQRGQQRSYRWICCCSGLAQRMGEATQERRPSWSLDCGDFRFSPGWESRLETPIRLRRKHTRESRSRTYISYLVCLMIAKHVIIY